MSFLRVIRDFLLSPFKREEENIFSKMVDPIFHISGMSFSNPGPSAIGIFLEDYIFGENEYKAPYTYGFSIPEMTDSLANYVALNAALNFAIKNDMKTVTIISNSELLINQCTGLWKVKSPALKEPLSRVIEKIAKLDRVILKREPRKEKEVLQKAHNLSRRMIDESTHEDIGFVPYLQESDMWEVFL